MKVLVTGGTGFVGNALTRKLLELGHEVTTISRRDSPDLRQLGVKVVRGDISSSDLDYSEILTDIKAVFHTASLVSMWGNFKDFYNTNVIGTRRLLLKSVEFGVESFIYTSSPSVVANDEDLRGVNESQPYPKKFSAYYPQTKAMAEKSVLSEHKPGKILTLSLRPHLIFGPGDTNLIPAILEKAETGKLKIIGEGDNTVDVTYIEDCVQAHIDALNALAKNPEVGGKSYFISQDEPVKMWDWINQVLNQFEKAPITKSIPVGIAKTVANVAENFSRVFAPDKEPVLTSFLVSEMSKDHYFDISAAKELLGFVPKYTVDEAVKKLN